MVQTTRMDPADFARLCLEDEMFGPGRVPAENEIRAQVADLRGAEQAEARELLARRPTKRNRDFRRRLDHLADLHDEAVAAAEQGQSTFHDLIQWGLGLRGDEHWRLLEPQESVMRGELSKLEAIRAPTARRERAERVRWYKDTIAQLGPVWRFVSAVDAFLHEEFPALGTLLWTSDWVLRLTVRQPSGMRYVDGGPRLSGVHGGGMIPTLRFEQLDFGVPEIEVEWSDSREETRQRFIASLEPIFYRRYAAETGALVDADPSTEDLRRDRRFRHSLNRDNTWARTIADLERFLDESHPPGKRPYTRDPLRQVRRDVHVWAVVKIGGILDWELAGAYYERTGDPNFRAYTGGKRSRYPTTPKGVRDAVGRAQFLLQQREI